MWKRCFVMLFVCVVTHNMSAQVVINEIMAANASCCTDPQGEYDDWIELYNPTDQPLDLAGLYLTDDVSQPSRWQFPLLQPARTTISPGGYLLIWADDDVQDAGLHADFKLKAGGEAVGLFDTDGLTAIDIIHFSAQRDDVSYGRYPDGALFWQHLDTPTPGSTNHRQAEGFVARPQISVTSRLFVEPFEVSITCATEGAAVYYTLDGSDPHGEMVRPDRRYYTTLYQGPLAITQSTTVRAVAFKEGWEPSEIVSHRYVYVHSEVRGFHSNLPIMVVESLEQRIGFEQGPAVCFLFEPNEGEARIGLSPDVSTLAGMDIRGQSSSNFPKKQYHLEIWDHDSRDRDIAWLGLPAESDWVLNGPYSDKSLMRNALSYQWARDTGHYAPRTRFIEMFLGEQSDALRMSDYVGVYCLTEKIKISPSRVDIAKLSPGDVNEPDITGGYLIKKDKDPRYEDLHFVTNSGQNLIYADPKGWYFEPKNPQSHPWWPRLFQDPAFQLRYADRWFAFRRGVFATERLLSTIDDCAMLLADAQQRNFERWPTLGAYVWPNWFIAETYEEEIDWMKSWLTARVAWMDQAIADEYAPVPVSFSQQGGQVESGYALHISASADRIYYTLDGSDPYEPETGMVSLVAEDAGKRVWIPTGPVSEAWKGAQAFSDRGWITHEGIPGGVGYEQRTGYESYIGLDLADRMAGQASGCYMRIPFTLEESPLDLDHVTLNVPYDDGFVAYLNGREIARANVDHTPMWKSAADAQNGDSRAVQWQAFSVTDVTLLRQGTNLLAIHGLNVSTTSSDFLMAATLTAVKASPAVDMDTHAYAGPIAVHQSTHVKARSWSGGRWSALNEAVFAVGPVAENLRITELMYHPQDLGHPDDPNTEFIELTNVGTESINLNLAQFTTGVRLVLPSVDVAPGGSVLVVSDMGAFTEKYGPDFPIVGVYQGHLSNAGERLVLQDAAGRIICDFTYDDDWYTNTDGQGYSLVVPNPEVADPQALSSKEAWRGSLTVHGSPGVWP